MRKITLVVCAIILSVIATMAQEPQKRPDPQPGAETKELFKIGVAGFTFAQIKKDGKADLDKALETLVKADVHYLCIKDFHLPFNSTDEEIADFHKKLKNKNITGYAVGPIYMKSKKEVDDSFEYAKRVGVKLIVGVPDYELLPYIDEKVKEYGFHYAIHIHGPDIKEYPDADDVWENVKNLDPRIGMCLDIGHNLRNGKDPVKALEKYHTRVFDMHLKDVTGDTRLGYSVEVGRGIIDFPALVKMMRKVKYDGVISLEHERNMDDPYMGIAESIGYFRAIIKATQK